MKRSEFKKWLDRGLRYGFPGEDKKETIIAKMEEAAGPIQWEPEEEIAPHLLLVAGAVIEETMGYRHTVTVVRESPDPDRTKRNLKILADMFEAYNRAQEGGPEGAPDVITKTRRGRTVHYAVGPVRATREMAERDVRLLKVGVWDGDE